MKTARSILLLVAVLGLTAQGCARKTAQRDGGLGGFGNVSGDTSLCQNPILDSNGQPVGFVANSAYVTYDFGLGYARIMPNGNGRFTVTTNQGNNPGGIWASFLNSQSYGRLVVASTCGAQPIALSNPFLLSNFNAGQSPLSVGPIDPYQYDMIGIEYVDSNSTPVGTSDTFTAACLHYGFYCDESTF